MMLNVDDLLLMIILLVVDDYIVLIIIEMTMINKIHFVEKIVLL